MCNKHLLALPPRLSLSHPHPVCPTSSTQLITWHKGTHVSDSWITSSGLLFPACMWSLRGSLLLCSACSHCCTMQATTQEVYVYYINVVMYFAYFASRWCKCKISAFENTVYLVYCKIIVDNISPEYKSFKKSFHILHCSGRFQSCLQ